MEVIVFGHLRRVGDWIAEQINMHPPLHAYVVVTSGAEYIEAARKVRDFALVVGQYKMHEYEDAERLLAAENIFPYRRVISAPTITAAYVEWASEQLYDGVIDLIAHPESFGEEVFKAITATKGCSHATVRFPLTSSVTGLIPFRDETDGDIVRLITAGLSNTEIAERVFLSVQTVRNRISRLLEASGARNRTHLAAMYLIPHTSTHENGIKPVLSIADHLPMEAGIVTEDIRHHDDCESCQHRINSHELPN